MYKLNNNSIDSKIRPLVDAKWLRDVPHHRQPNYFDTPYFRLSHAFIKETFLDSLSYEAKEDDLFIATYPKNGTTWTQQIVYLIQHQAQPPDSFDHLYSNSVFLEMKGKEAIKRIQPPGSIKVHLPLELTPWNDKAKYIVVIRNPKDALVSYFHHHVGMDIYYDFKDGSFDDFFNMWIGGQCEFGDYYHFVNSWLSMKHLDNVFFITYEFMKEFPGEAICQIADFMDSEKYGKVIREDKELLQSIITHSSVSAMKKRFSKALQEQSSTQFEFIRKGVVNDWKNLMSEEQNILITKRFKEEAAKNPLLMNLWHDYSWLNDSIAQK